MRIEAKRSGGYFGGGQSVETNDDHVNTIMEDFIVGSTSWGSLEAGKDCFLIQSPYYYILDFCASKNHICHVKTRKKRESSQRDSDQLNSHASVVDLDLHNHGFQSIHAHISLPTPTHI